MTEKKKRSVPATVLAVLALLGSVNAVYVGGTGSYNSVWEALVLYGAPTLLLAVVAIAIRRSALTVVALAAALLAIVAFFLLA